MEIFIKTIEQETQARKRNPPNRKENKNVILSIKVDDKTKPNHYPVPNLSHNYFHHNQ